VRLWVKKMEHIVIEVQNREKARRLIDFLSSLDFVHSAKLSANEYKEKSKLEEDFFSFAGIWENRNISKKSIRQNSWPEQYK